MALNSNGRLIDLDTPQIMGIINVTPDSFYDGSRFSDAKNALIKAEQMLNEGAKILDIGGMSSRPGAVTIEVDEELKRVLPVITSIKKEFSEAIISIDTFRKEVAKAAVEHGADVINDISSGEIDPTIIDYAGKRQIPYILMHMKGIPENMQDNPDYDNVVQQVLQYLIKRIDFCKSRGIQDLIIDPGFGFGKSLSHNYQLLKQLKVFQLTECPILVGISRKSMIYKTIEGTAQTAVHGTSAAHMVALQNGAKILRVHDVEAARQTIRIWTQLYN